MVSVFSKLVYLNLVQLTPDKDADDPNQFLVAVSPDGDTLEDRTLGIRSSIAAAPIYVTAASAGAKLL